MILLVKQNLLYRAGAVVCSKSSHCNGRLKQGRTIVEVENTTFKIYHFLKLEEQKEKHFQFSLSTEKICNDMTPDLIHII